MINNVMKIFIAGVLALTMVWFADRFVSFLVVFEYDIAWSYIMGWLMRNQEPCVCCVSYRVARILIRALLLYYWRLVVALFAYMVTHIMLFYLESKNRRVSIVLVAITVLFFAAQFYVPIVYRPNDCYFASPWGLPLEDLNEKFTFIYKNA